MRKIILIGVLWFAVFSVTHAQQQADTLTIFFGINESIIDDSKAKQLNKLITDKAITSITICGYTDFLGCVAYNQKLSEKRSANVYNYLISKRIEKKDTRGI
jgi:outer membrane protein OmpA-like peptidoglycan-associated protein